MGTAMYVWLVLVLVIAASMLLAVGSNLVRESRSRPSAGKEYNSTLSPFVTTVALVYGTLLGFTVVVAWEQFSSAEANVANEASTLATMYRQTVAMPATEQQEIRDLLRKYTTAVKGPEWASQSENDGGTSDTARSAITEMYRVIGRQDPDAATSAINGEFLGQLTVWPRSETPGYWMPNRESRGCCGVAWLSVACLLVGMTGFMRLDSTRAHIVLSGAVAVLLGCCCSSSTASTIRSGPKSESPPPVPAFGRGVRRGRLGQVNHSAG